MNYVNGRFVADDPNSTLPFSGSIFGDAIFETMLCFKGRIHLLGLHLQRLVKGATVLGLECDTNKIVAELEACLQEHDSSQQCFRVRLVLQRARGDAGYSVKGLSTQRLVTLLPIDIPQHQHLSVTLSSIPISDQPHLAGIKHGNRLEQILAKQKLENTGFDEAILLDRDERVVECISSNIYVLESNKVYSPVLDRAGVAGVAREWLKTSANAFALEYVEGNISLEKLLGADAVFMSNAVLGFRQIVSYSDADSSREWPEHPVVKRVQSGFIESLVA